MDEGIDANCLLAVFGQGFFHKTWPPVHRMEIGNC